MLFLVFLCTLFAGPAPDFIGVPQSQLTQETIPLLKRELATIETRVQAKKKFFSGKKDFSDAFWEFSGINLFHFDVLNAQKNTITIQYQERLTQTFRNLVDEGVSTRVSRKLSNIVEKKWNAENERDALNLRLLHLLSENLEQHKTFVQLLHTIEDENRRVLGQTTEPSKTNTALVHIVEQEQYIQQLKKGLIQLWFHDKHASIDKTVQTLLSDENLQNWSLERQSQTISLFSLWITEEKAKEKANILLAGVGEKQSTKQQEQLEEQWRLLQGEWPTTISQWGEQQANAELEALKKQQESMSKDALPLEKEMVTYQLELLQTHIEQRSTIRNETELRESQVRLEQAKKKEQEAKQSEDQKRIQQEVVRLREMETLLREEELKRHTQVQAQLELAQTERTAIDALFVEWEALAPLAANKEELLQNHAKRVRVHKKLIQEQILALDTLPPVGPFSTKENAPASKRALLDIKRAVTDRERNIQQEQRDWYTLWVAINEHEYQTKSHDTRTLDGQAVWNNLLFEGEFISLAWSQHLSHIKRWFKDINHILDLVRITVWGVLLIICWNWVLGRLFAGWLWVRTWLHQQDFLIVGYTTRDEHADDVEEEQKVLIHQIYYLISALFLNSVLYGTPLRIVSSVIVFYIGLQLVSILTKMWKSTVENQKMLQRSISIFVITYFGWNVLEECLRNLFFAYQGALLLQWMQTSVLLLFVAVQLGTWSEFLEKKSDDTVGLLTLKKLRSHLSNGILGSRLRTIFSLVIICFDGIGRLTFWCIEHSSVFGSTLARNALEETATTHEGLVSFDSQAWSFHNTLVLEPYQQSIMKSIADWKQTKKRGSIVVTADEGMGKSHLLSLIQNEEHDMPTHSFVTTDIERNKNWNRLTVLRWMARSLEVDPDSIYTAQDVIDVLQKRPPTLFFLDNVHHVFLRIVEGFVVLDTLFSVIQETSGRHCWILTCHLPTWEFITSPAIPIQSNFFRSEVYFAPWSVQQLQVHMKRYIEQQRRVLDFSSLTVLKTQQSIHRAEMSYWRLLTDASKGNPSTAFELLQLSLFQEEGAKDNVLQVKLFPLLKTTEIQNLDDMSCFVLSSIILHQEIRFSELCRSLRINPEVIQSICKNLVDMDIVVLNNNEYTVRTIWYPWVERVLLQQRFIFMRD